LDTQRTLRAETLIYPQEPWLENLRPFVTLDRP